MNANNWPSQPEARFGAAGVGAAFGTFLVGLAEVLPDEHSTAKKILVYAAPTVGILFGVLWLWSRRLLNERRLDRLTDKTIDDLTKTLRDPNLSETEREGLENELKEIRANKYKFRKAQIAYFAKSEILRKRSDS